MDKRVEVNIELFKVETDLSVEEILESDDAFLMEGYEDKFFTYEALTGSVYESLKQLDLTGVTKARITLSEVATRELSLDDINGILDQ